MNAVRLCLCAGQSVAADVRAAAVPNGQVQADLLQACVPHAAVVAFVWAAVRKVVPTVGAGVLMTPFIFYPSFTSKVMFIVFPISPAYNGCVLAKCCDGTTAMSKATCF